MKRLTLLFAVLLLTLTTVSARSIRGQVRSESDSTVLVGALCRLMVDNKFIDGATTDMNGEFEISTSVKSKLRLEVSMTGFNTSQVLIESDKNVNVGTVYLSEGKMLDEVEVVANSMVDIKGRTIVFPSEADVKASSTSLSLFQKLPLAGLDANPIARSLTVDGGAPMILINGVPSSVSDLLALQPKDIAKIEFSRITPARYADRGVSGLLNITLKKRDDGGQVYLWGQSAVNAVFVEATLRTSYHQGPSQFTLSYNPSWRNNTKTYDFTTQSYIGDDFRVDIEESDRNPFYYHYHPISLKYDFSPNVHTLFSATFSIRPNNYKNRQYTDYRDSFLGDYESEGYTKSKDINPSLDLFFKRDFNDKNALEAQVVGTLTSSDYRHTNDFTYSDGTPSDYLTDVTSKRRSLITEVSYIHSFSDKTDLAAGVQNTLSHSENKYVTTDYKPLLTENNNYAYVRLGQQIGRLYFSVSTGLKMYWIKNADNKRTFVRNLTNAQINWNISQQWSIAGSFQYVPSIPSLSTLTDYAQQMTPYLISNGNPDLKASQRFSYQLMPTFQYKKFSASLFLGYNTTQNFVMNDITYMGQHLFLSRTVNARKAWDTSADLVMRLSEIYGFGANVNLGVRHFETMGDKWCYHLTAFAANIYLWWNKGPFTVSYWRKFPGKYLRGSYVGTDENSDELTFEYRPDKHWTIGASWMYMFQKDGWRYKAWGYSTVNPYESERYIKNSANMVTLSVSYTADFGSIFRPARRSLNNKDNESSILKL